MLDRILGKKRFLPRGNRVKRKEKDSRGRRAFSTGYKRNRERKERREWGRERERRRAREGERGEREREKVEGE